MSRGQSSKGGTMHPTGIKPSAGQFGLKKNVSVPVEHKEETVVEVEEVIEAVETKEAETIPAEVEKVTEPKEDVGIEDIEDSFVCAVCDRKFSSRIGLVGHMRGPCGKKKKK